MNAKHAITFLGAVSLVLAACGGAAPPTQTPTPVPPSATPIPAPTLEPTEAPVPTLAPYAGPSRIVFSSNRGDDPNKVDLYLIYPEGGEITPLNTGFESAVLPSWAPDGNRIAFAIRDVWNLYTVFADGTGLTQVTDFRSNNPDWSPDGRQLVFQSDHRNEPQDTPDIYVIDADGQNLSEILDDPDVVDYAPRWSPDGSAILFLSRRAGMSQIFVMNPDGSNPTQLAESGTPVKKAVWSPDGQRIAFISGTGPMTDLYVIDKAGAMDSVVRLTEDNFQDEDPSWSPDGERIAFVSNRSGNWDLWLINADGSGLTALTDDAYSDAFPDWSP